MSRKRKSLESGLPELKSYAAKRMRINPVSERKPSAKKTTTSKKKTSNKKEKTVFSLMDAEEPVVHDEFQLFTAMDIDDNSNVEETENHFKTTVKRLFPSEEDVIASHSAEIATPERLWEENMAHVGSLPNTSSSHKIRKASENASRNISSGNKLSNKKNMPRENNESDLISMRPQYTLSHQQTSPIQNQKPLLANETVRQLEPTASVPVVNRDVSSLEAVPVAVMESKNNSMWFTWLMGFFVLYFLGSSFWSINMGDPGKNMSIPSNTNNVFTGESNQVGTNQIDEPNLWMKNYSVPRISLVKNSDNSSTAIQSNVDSEMEETWVSFEETESFVSIETTITEDEGTDVGMSLSFEYYSMIDMSTFTVVPTDTTSSTLFVEEVSISSVVTSEEVVEINDLQVTEEAKYLSEEEFPTTNLVSDDAEPNETIADNFVFSKQASFVSSSDIPTIFPVTSNLALDTSGVRILAKESTKKCMKAKKWNPFLCHRPLRTVYNHKPIGNAADCFAFYLERNDSQKSYKNTITLKLFQPAKAIYGFGLTHFVADSGNDSSLFNVSCAPKDVSFTVLENIPTNHWLESAPISQNQPIIEEIETVTSNSFTFDDSEGKDQQEELNPADEEEKEEKQNAFFEKLKTIPSMKKSFQFPWLKKDKSLSFVDSFQIPTTFDGFVFDPLGPDVTRGDYTASTANPGVSVTQFFPLKTAHFPHYVDKVRVQVHSTHGDSDLACVYRVQVYGDA